MLLLHCYFVLGNEEILEVKYLKFEVLFSENFWGLFFWFIERMHWGMLSKMGVFFKFLNLETQIIKFYFNKIMLKLFINFQAVTIKKY